MKIIKNDIKKYVLGGGLITLGLLMGACSDSSDNKSPATKETSSLSNTYALSGTAAVGNPIANGTLIAKCSDGSGFINTVTTQANGTWTGNIANSALPCALQITGGNPNVTLHSFANHAGNVNITPLTDLAVALQINTLSGQSLSDWFNDPNTGSANLSSIASSLANAADALRTAMTTAGFNLPSSWSAGSTAIFNTAFTADPVSDPYDKLLEDLAESIRDDKTLADYNALLSSLTSGGALPDAPADTSDTGGAGDTDGDNAVVALAGDYSSVVVSSNAAWEGGISHDGYALAVQGSTVEINISDTGIVTIGDHTFDPKTASYTFEDRTSVEYALDAYYLLSTVNADGDELSLSIFVEPSNLQEPVAWRLVRKFSRGNNASTTVTTTLEQRPIPADVTTLFTDLKNLGATELTLLDEIPPTVLYTTLGLCDKARFDMIKDNPTGYAWQYQVHAKVGMYRFAIGEYVRRTARHSDFSQGIDSRKIIFRGGSVDEITLGDTDNYVDVVLYTKTGLKPVLTNDPAKIAAAGCDTDVAEETGGDGEGDTSGDDGTSTSEEALDGKAGITALIDGVRYTYNSNVSWGSGRLAAHPAGSDSPDQHDAYNHWKLVSFPMDIGTYQCSSSYPKRLMNFSSGNTSRKSSWNFSPEAKTCEVEVLSSDQGVVTGRFTGTITASPNNASYKRDVLIEDGFFRYQAPSP